MGLDASVKCRCWEDGLCHPPASLAPRLRYNSETAEVTQSIPTNISIEKLCALDLEYYNWIMDDACVHQRMEIVAERISNWAGLRSFQHALRSLGEASYPALLREIPNRNGGLTKPADARICLAELDCFCSAGPFGRIVELLDGNSSAVLHSRVESYDGWLGTDGATGISHRLNSDGIFQIEHGRAGVMQHDPDAKILFRSKAFTQALTPTGKISFTDLLSGKQFTCASGIEDASGHRPALLKITKRRDVPGRYACRVEALRRVFSASIDTGHPVLWS